MTEPDLAPVPSVRHSLALSIATACITAIIFGAAVTIMEPGQDFQGDLKTYYAASAASRAKLNPYRIESLMAVLRKPWDRPFVYPPYTLWLLKPLGSIPYETVFYVFLVLKCGATVLLVLLWRRAWPKLTGDVLFIPFALFAFNYTILIDFVAGNISVFEQVAIWSAIVAIIGKRTSLFCLLICGCALFKLVPIIFLGLLPFMAVPHRLRYGVAAVSAFACALVAAYVAQPELSYGFWLNLAAIDSSGSAGLINPSSLPFARDVCSKVVTLAHPEWLGMLVYVVLVACVLAISWRAWLKIRLIETRDGRVMIAMLFCFVVALILPRFKDYSYILLILPAYFSFRMSRKTGAFLPLALLAMLPSAGNSVPAVHSISYLLIEYRALLIAFVGWGVLCYESLGKPLQPTKPQENVAAKMASTSPSPPSDKLS